MMTATALTTMKDISSRKTTNALHAGYKTGDFIIPKKKTRLK